jgi:hypothetical protein
MAQTTNLLRDLLEKIKGDAQRALALLPSEAELTSHRPEMHCMRIGKGFTRLLSAVIAAP